MKCGKLTAKLRDAVPVCFIVNGREVKRYKNIEIPDEVKELEYSDFRFDVPESGAITFKIMFDEGILPEVWPVARERARRTTRSETQATEATTDPVAEEATAAETVGEQTVSDTQQAAEVMVASYHVTGEQRKALVQNIAAWLQADAVYQRAPTYAYKIGEYTVDRDGELTGPMNEDLLAFLAGQGYLAG